MFLYKYCHVINIIEDSKQRREGEVKGGKIQRMDHKLLKAPTI